MGFVGDRASEMMCFDVLRERVCVTDRNKCSLMCKNQLGALEVMIYGLTWGILRLLGFRNMC
jgi:hypothetical protein